MNNFRPVAFADEVDPAVVGQIRALKESEIGLLEVRGVDVKNEVINRLGRMVEDFPEDSIDFILDLGWVDFAGQNVVELMQRLKGRLICTHLKDYADLPADGSITTKIYMRPIYEGKVDYDTYIKALQDVGCEHTFVEQDSCYDESPFECLRRSNENVIAHFPELK